MILVAEMSQTTPTFRRTPSGVRFFWITIWLIHLLVGGCSRTHQSTQAELTGETMGTTFSITIPKLPSNVSVPKLSAGIEGILQQVNQQMSNWIQDSEISRFNQSSSTDWFEVSPATALVIEQSIRYSKESYGAFDVTVAPLIDAWGFGPQGREIDPPDEEQLAELRTITGTDKLEVRTDPPAIRKAVPEVSVNLSAIAKGYGVDAIAEYLEGLGIMDYLVEIGGEVRMGGRKVNGQKWRVGVERPKAGQRSLQKIVMLTDSAMATSGDYRNFIERNGQKYSHTIDPVSLKPITHRLASVTVMAKNCLEADAVATALMVMGPETGYDWAEKRQISALMLIHTESGFEERSTSAWNARQE